MNLNVIVAETGDGRRECLSRERPRQVRKKGDDQSLCNSIFVFMCRDACRAHDLPPWVSNGKVSRCTSER